MVVYIKNLDCLAVSEYQNSAGFPVDPKAPKSHATRLEEFALEARMKRITLKQTFLFLKLSSQSMFPNVRVDFSMDGENNHARK